jgi:hypothetical protein
VKVFAPSLDSKNVRLLPMPLSHRILELSQAYGDTTKREQFDIEEYASSRVSGDDAGKCTKNTVVKHDSQQILADETLYNSAVEQAMSGMESVEMIMSRGVAIPKLYMLAAVPVRDNNQILGAVILTYGLDAAITRGIQKNLGLEGALYAGDQLSYIMRNAESLLGMKETNASVIRTYW